MNVYNYNNIELFKNIVQCDIFLFRANTKFKYIEINRSLRCVVLKGLVYCT